MEQDQEKWTEAVLNSMEGARRASPSPDLFDTIETRLLMEEAPTPVKTSFNWLAVAAAVVLLAVNGWAVFQYAQAQNTSSNNLASQESTLVSGYDLYEL